MDYIPKMRWQTNNAGSSAAEDQNAPELPVEEVQEEPAVKPETGESDPEPEKPTKPKRKTKPKVKTCSICGGKIEVHDEEKTLECLKELPGFDELEKLDVFNMRDVLDFALKQDVVLHELRSNRVLSILRYRIINSVHCTTIRKYYVESMPWTLQRIPYPICYR